MARANSKQQHPLNPSIKLVDRADDLTYEDEGVMKAEMRCGHALSPTSITKWCIQELEKGHALSCPICSKKWSYTEVREAALLTAEERKHFEENMSFEDPVVKSWEAKHCPACNTLVERGDEKNLCVQCVLCSEEKGKRFFFCWNCLLEWKGPYPRSDKCDNKDCMDPKLKLLLNCRDITLQNVPGVHCPSVRACPTCWTLVEHNTLKCKNIICLQCTLEFCFLCLKLTSICCRDGGWYNMCPDGVAPRQTTIGTKSRLPSKSQIQSQIPEQTTASRQEQTPLERTAHSVQLQHPPPERPASIIQDQHPPPERPASIIQDQHTHPERPAHSVQHQNTYSQRPVHRVKRQHAHPERPADKDCIIL